MKQKQLVWLSAAALAALMVLAGCPTPDDNKTEPPPPEEVYDVNLAKTAVVTAPGHSSYETNPTKNAAYINDGSMKPPYISQKPTMFPEEIVLTWTEYKVFNTVVYYSQWAKYQGVNDIEIAVSDDGTAWKTVFKKKELTYNTAAETTFEWQVFQFEKQTAKMLRFLVNDANYDWEMYVINELEVFLEREQRRPAAQMPAITMNSTTGRVREGGTLQFTANASVTDEGSLSWQWYSNTAKNNTGGTKITNASGTGGEGQFSVPTTTAGEFYYYVEFTNSGPNGASPTSVAGDVITVKVISTDAVEYDVDVAQYATITTTSTNEYDTTLTDMISPSGKWAGWNCYTQTWPVEIVLTWTEDQVFNTVTSTVRFASDKGIKSAEIWVSADGETGWTKVAEATDITYPTSEEYKYEDKVFTFEEQVAKGLKVVVNDAAVGWGMWSINQLTVTLHADE